MSYRTSLIIISFLVSFIFSCVNPRLLRDAREQNERLQAENEELRSNISGSDSSVSNLQDRIRKMEKQLVILIEDTTLYGERYRKEQKHYANLNELYEKVNVQYQELLRRSSDENERLKLELEEKKRQLDKKEKELLAKEKDLEQKLSEINLLEESLADRQKRVEELESLIAKQDSIVNILRNKIADALISFDDEDLTIEVKDGKVYVSISEELLFKSGSTIVDAKGKKALEKLAKVLEKQADIDILIEGHTDNVPFKEGGTTKDNWDLSVLRATSIVRILVTASDIDPARITSAGRGEHHPIASNDNADGRKKNRRTEIILAPKLDQLYQLLEKE